MIERVGNVLVNECGLSKNERLVVGVSGGADSLVLLDLLSNDGWNILAAHFNHNLREEAGEDEAFVRSFCTKRSIEYINGSADVGSYAARERKNLEEAARELRYQFLLDTAGSEGAAAVVVGHHANDQVETVLMHLIRGTGLNGLTGMDTMTYSGWHQTIPLVRPMLNIWREEIEEYCLRHNLQPRVDESNLDTGYLRNRLRHEIIPSLINVDKGFQENVLRMTRLLKGDEDLLTALSARIWDQVCLNMNDQQVVLDRNEFLAQPVGFQRRLIQTCFSYILGGLKDIDFNVIERAREAAADPPSSNQIDLSKKLRLIVDNNRLIVAWWDGVVKIPDWPQMHSEGPVVLHIPGIIYLSNEWALKVEIFPRSDLPQRTISGNTDPNTGFLDADSCEERLLMRGRYEGDSFLPLGMEGKSIKVSDLMINAKVPKLARSLLPLVESGDEIVWIAGFPPSHSARVTEKTTRVIKFSLMKTSNL